MDSLKNDSCLYTTQYIYRLEGVDGETGLQYVMKMFRCGFRTIGGLKVESVLDYNRQPGGFDALEYRLAEGISVIIQLSDKKPEIKATISIERDNTENVVEVEARVRNDIESIVSMDCRMGYCCE